MWRIGNACWRVLRGSGQAPIPACRGHPVLLPGCGKKVRRLKTSLDFSTTPITSKLAKGFPSVAMVHHPQKLWNTAPSELAFLGRLARGGIFFPTFSIVLEVSS